jgi:hypothetical protein
MDVAVPREPSHTTPGVRPGRTGPRAGFDLFLYLLVVLAAVDVGALATLILTQFINTSAEIYAAIFVSYGLLAVGMAAFLRIAALARAGSPDPDPPGSGRKGGGGAPSGTRIILALILAILLIILVFTILYYLTGAPSYLTTARGATLKHTWLQAMFLAVGVLGTVQSPPLLVSWAGCAAFIQELIDLVFLGGVVTIALGRINQR